MQSVGRRDSTAALLLLGEEAGGEEEGEGEEEGHSEDAEVAEARRPLEAPTIVVEPATADVGGVESEALAFSSTTASKGLAVSSTTASAGLATAASGTSIAASPTASSSGVAADAALPGHVTLVLHDDEAQSAGGMSRSSSKASSVEASQPAEKASAARARSTPKSPRRRASLSGGLRKLRQSFKGEGGLLLVQQAAKAEDEEMKAAIKRALERRSFVNDVFMRLAGMREFSVKTPGRRFLSVMYMVLFMLVQLLLHLTIDETNNVREARDAPSILLHVVILSLTAMQLSIITMVQRKTLAFIAAVVEEERLEVFSERARRLTFVVPFLGAFATTISITAISTRTFAYVRSQALFVIGMTTSALTLTAFASIVSWSSAVLTKVLNDLRLDIVRHKVKHREASRRYARIRRCMLELSQDFSIALL